MSAKDVCAAYGWKLQVFHFLKQIVGTLHVIHIAQFSEQTDSFF